MNTKTHQRVKRILLGALLSSDLTARELTDLAAELTTQSAFAFELGLLIQASIDQTYGPDLAKHAPTSEPGNLEGAAYAIIQRRRLSKREVLDMISSGAGFGKYPGLSPDKPMRDIIRNFFAFATMPDIQNFMKQLQPGYGDDPYLRGIMHRS